MLTGRGAFAFRWFVRISATETEPFCTQKFSAFCLWGNFSTFWGLWSSAWQKTHFRVLLWFVWNTGSRFRNDCEVSNLKLSIGFRRVYCRRASVNLTKSQVSHSGSFRTRSPLMMSNLSSVEEIIPFTSWSEFSVSRDCTLWDSLSWNSWIRLGFPVEVYGNSRISFT